MRLRKAHAGNPGPAATAVVGLAPDPLPRASHVPWESHRIQCGAPVRELQERLPQMWLGPLWIPDAFEPRLGACQGVAVQSEKGGTETGQRNVPRMTPEEGRGPRLRKRGRKDSSLSLRACLFTCNAVL